MKFAKTIRFDKSDLNVFEIASEEAEWAISGAFEFSNDLNENLTGKRKQSFANGFLGLDTFGRSTLVSIVSIEKYGAPNLNEAKKVAKEEINFMIDICENHEIGSLMAVSRTLEDDGIHEKFRHIPKGDACSNQKIWATVSEE